MSTATLTPAATTAGLIRDTDALFARKRVVALAIPALILAYFAYIFIAFDIAGLRDRASLDNAMTLVSDSYSYKTHVARDNRSGEVSIAIEGERKGAYPDGMSPDWVTLGDDTVITLPKGHEVLFLADGSVRYDIPGYGLVTANPGRSGVNAVLPEGDVPDWINASKNRLAIKTEAGRLTITRNRTEVFRYAQWGGSSSFSPSIAPITGLVPVTLAQRAANGEAGAIWSDFWNNRMWQHHQVAWAIFETILMAFLGYLWRCNRGPAACPAGRTQLSRPSSGSAW